MGILSFLEDWQDRQKEQQQQQQLSQLFADTADQNYMQNDDQANWNNFLSTGQNSYAPSFQTQLLEAAAIDPSKYGQSAFQQISPASHLDDQVKRAQIANYHSEASTRQQEADEKRRENNMLYGDPSQSQDQYGPSQQYQPPRASGTAGTLPIRNNNPLNLKDPSTGQFRQFSTAQEGKQAAIDDLNLKIAGRSNAMRSRFGDNYTPTLANVISTWAPSSDKNNTAQYIANVSKATGITPDQTLTQDDITKLLPAMAQQEGGSSVLAAAQKSENPTDAKPNDLITAATQAMNNRQDLNWDALNGYAPGIQSTVRAMVNGSDFAARSMGAKMQPILIGLATQVDPSYNPAVAKEKAKTLASLAPDGDIGKQVQSQDAFLKHLVTYARAYKALGNTDNGVLDSGIGVGASNSMANSDLVNRWFGSGDDIARQKNFAAAEAIAGPDYARVINKGNDTALADRNKADSLLGDKSLGPTGQAGLLSTIQQQLKDRMDTTTQAVKTGLGINSDVTDFYSPEAKKAWQALQSGDIDALASIDLPDDKKSDKPKKEEKKVIHFDKNGNRI